MKHWVSLSLQNLFWNEHTHTAMHADVHIYLEQPVKDITSQFISYTLLVLGWTFAFSAAFNSSWHRFNKVLETFLWDFCPYSDESVTQLLQSCRLYIHDRNL